MSESEIDNLVVRLTGDGSDFRTMMEESQRLVDVAAKKIEANTKQVEGFMNRVASMGEKMKGALELFGVGNALKDSFQSFSAYERQMISLKAAIEFNGRAVKPVMDDYTKFAEEVQHSTLVTKGETMALLEQFEAAGFSGKAAKQLATDTIGLATATKMGNEHAAMLVTAMARGNAEMLRRVPALRGIHGQAQMVEKAQSLMALGLKQASEISETASGKIEHLEHAFHGLWKELGAGVATVITPVVTGMQRLVEWFKSLDPTIRQAAMGIPAIVIAFKGFASVAGTLFAPVLAMLTPMNLAIAGVTMAVTYLVDKLGGWAKVFEMVKTTAGNAWDYVKQRTSEFLEWVSPVTDALMSLWDALWEGIKAGAVFMWEGIKSAWNAALDFVSGILDALGLSSQDTWDNIRDTFRDTILFMEFTFRNFGKVWEVAVLGIAVAGSHTWDFIKDSFTALVAFMGGGIRAVQAGWSGLWAAIKNPSKAAFAGIMDDMGKAFNRGFDEIANKLGAGKSPLTKTLEGDFDKAKKTLGESFKDFKDQKLYDFAENRASLDNKFKPVEKAAEDAGLKVGGNFSAAAKKEMEKFDVALAGSSEALFRLASQKEKFDLDRNKSNFAKGSGADAPRADAAARFSSEAKARTEVSNDLLRQIRDGIVKKKPETVITGAGI